MWSLASSALLGGGLAGSVLGTRNRQAGPAPAPAPAPPTWRSTASSSAGVLPSTAHSAPRPRAVHATSVCEPPPTSLLDTPAASAAAGEVGGRGGGGAASPSAQVAPSSSGNRPGASAGGGDPSGGGGDGGGRGDFNTNFGEAVVTLREDLP
jgi:hypothetical protein